MCPFVQQWSRSVRVPWSHGDRTPRLSTSVSPSVPAYSPESKSDHNNKLLLRDILSSREHKEENAGLRKEPERPPPDVCEPGSGTSPRLVARMLFVKKTVNNPGKNVTMHSQIETFSFTGLGRMQLSHHIVGMSLGFAPQTGSRFFCHVMCSEICAYCKR